MCAIDPDYQCGEREPTHRADGTPNFFRSGYPCELLKNHAGPFHESCDGQWPVVVKKEDDHAADP